MRKITTELLEDMHRLAQTRRQFVGWGAGGLGAFFMNAALAAQQPTSSAGLSFKRDPSTPLSVLPPQFPAKVKRVIYLHMGGAPSQLELFDHKPLLSKFDGHLCPESFVKGKRFAFIRGVPKMLGPQFPFHQTGKNGTWISDRLPHTEKLIDDLCLIKSMKTDQFNHAPAQLLVQTGDARTGSCFAWIMGHIWPGQRKSEPARLHRAGLVRAWPHGQRRQAALGFGLPAKRVSGRGMPLRR